VSGIERSEGLPLGFATLAGGGVRGITEELDQIVQGAAEALVRAYRYPVVIRFNSDRYSGGAWLRTHEPDGVWLNAEVGITARLITPWQAEDWMRNYPGDGLVVPGLTLYAIASERAIAQPADVRELPEWQDGVRPGYTAEHVAVPAALSCLLTVAPPACVHRVFPVPPSLRRYHKGEPV
jgi:hypothetical protein